MNERPQWQKKKGWRQDKEGARPGAAVAAGEASTTQSIDWVQAASNPAAPIALLPISENTQYSEKTRKKKGGEPSWAKALARESCEKGQG